MSTEVFCYLQEIIPEIMKQNPKLFQDLDKHRDWYEKRKYFIEQNHILLENVSKKLSEKYENSFTAEDFFFMQKLYLLYPDCCPKKLLSLSWDNVKTILSLCEVEKRKFYTDVCFVKNLDVDTLRKYILNDLYEKVVCLVSEINNYDEVTNPSFLDKVLKIYPMVWQ